VAFSIVHCTTGLQSPVLPLHRRLRCSVLPNEIASVVADFACAAHFSPPTILGILSAERTARRASATNRGVRCAAPSASRYLGSSRTGCAHCDHESTVSANGVEDFRQKTPENIVAIARVLLEAGADVTAESDAYVGIRRRSG